MSLIENIKNQPSSPIDQLSFGLLKEFTSLRDLEAQLEQIVSHQKNLIESFINMNLILHSEEFMEVQLMVRNDLKRLIKVI